MLRIPILILSLLHCTVVPTNPLDNIFPIFFLIPSELSLITAKSGIEEEYNNAIPVIASISRPKVSQKCGL